MQKELKPCPFCGGKAKLVSFPAGTEASCNGKEKYNPFSAGVVLMGCETEGCILHMDIEAHKASLFFLFGSEDEAAKGWNRRVTADDPEG